MLEPIKQLESNGLTCVDLFCGAGIGAYGVKKAGYEMLWAVDNDKDAVRTYNLNIGNHAICEDIRKIQPEDIPKCDLMIATPVCKPFSVCGARRLTNDEKYGDLLAETVRLFSQVKPKALFFENVAGIAMGESLPIFKGFCRLIESYGYHIYWSIVNSFELGVPQQRERVFMVAISDDVKNEFIAPKKTLKRTTQRDALWDLHIKGFMCVPNHYDTINCSQKMFTGSGNFSVNFRQNSWDEPSQTVLSKHSAALIHPDVKYVKQSHIDNSQDNNSPGGARKMSVREHLRLQTVGDDFYFPDDIGIMEQYNRCSGVPSLVAYKYTCAIADCLLGKTPLRTSTFKSKKKLF